MNKKGFFVLVSLLVVLTISILCFLIKPQLLPEPLDCVDCGEGGWQKMDETCKQTISNKDEFKNCLLNFNWSLVNQDTSIEEIEEAYIEIGGTEIMNHPTLKSIKVFIYQRWAVDTAGNLYLLGYLG